MADDNLLDDDDLLGIGEFDEEIDGDLDESLLDDEIPTKKPVSFLKFIFFWL